MIPPPGRWVSGSALCIIGSCGLVTLSVNTPGEMQECTVEKKREKKRNAHASLCAVHSCARWNDFSGFHIVPLRMPLKKFTRTSRKMMGSFPLPLHVEMSCRMFSWSEFPTWCEKCCFCDSSGKRGSASKAPSAVVWKIPIGSCLCHYISLICLSVCQVAAKKQLILHCGTGIKTFQSHLPHLILWFMNWFPLSSTCRNCFSRVPIAQ